MNRKPVLRMCIISREKLSREELFRIVRLKDNTIVIDYGDTRVDGRGAYLKKDKDVISKARKNKQLDRHLQTTIDDKIYDELDNYLNK